jgi:hypothetical protein
MFLYKEKAYTKTEKSAKGKKQKVECAILAQFWWNLSVISKFHPLILHANVP